MSEKYKTTFRGYLIDNHSPDPPVITLENLSADEFEKFFVEADIDHCMVYCKDHWGNSYYDTKIGKKHQGLREDWVGTLASVLKKHKIEFIAYYCFEYDTYASVTHPEWSTKKSDGAPLVCGAETEGARAHWGMPCYETGYRKYVLGQLEEIVTRYHPDSLFIDIFGKSLCYCDACRKKFFDRYGYDLPESEQGRMEHNRDIMEFLDSQAEEMLDDVLRTVKKLDPDLAVSVNFSAHYPKSFRDKLDYLYTEPWAGNWLSGAYARDVSDGKYPQLGPGDVSQVYDYKKAEIYQLAAAEIAAQGCRVFMYSEPMHPDGTLDFTEAKKIGSAYREVEKFEHLLSDRTVLADIAILQSDLSDELLVDHPTPVRSVARAQQSGLHRKALLGAMKLCDALNYTWQVVPEKEINFERMQKYKAVLIPNLFYVSGNLQKNLEHYVQDGGCLIASGESGLYDSSGVRRSDFSLAGLYGCHFLAQNETYKRNDWGAFVSQTKDAVWNHCDQTTPPVSSSWLEVEVGRAEVLGSFITPVTEVTDTQWVNWGCPPPGERTQFPAISRNRIGKGTVISFYFDFFSMQAEGFSWCAPFLQGVFESCINPSVYLETPYKNVLEYTCYERASEKTLILHELSAMARLTDGDTPEIPGGTLTVHLKGRKITGIRMAYPMEKEIPIRSSEDGRAFSADLEALRMHSIYLISYR